MKSRQPSIFVKLTLDLAMALLFIASLGFRNTGAVAHELMGLTFCALCILHTTINWQWFKNILKGKYTLRKVANTILNLLLPITAVILCISGAMNSRHVFGFLNLNGSMEIRQIHSSVAYWSIVLIGIHVGMHWSVVLGTVKKNIGVHSQWILRPEILRGATLLIVLYGVWASFDRAMWSKLFLGFSFDFWDSSRPEFLFYANNLAIMALYISVAHYFFKLTARKKAATAPGSTST